MREKLMFRAARALASLPSPWQVRLAGGAPVVVDGQTLSPDLQLLLAVGERRQVKWNRSPSPQRVRRSMARETRIMGGVPLDVRAVRDLEVPGPTGPLRARLYSPFGSPFGSSLGSSLEESSAAPAPLLLFFHGGGFVFGDVDTHDAPCRILCRHGGVHVLSVEYRLAPEHPFPAAVDDAIAAYAWTRAHAADFGADPNQVGVGGDSAGGNLAAVVTQHARDAKLSMPSCQLLIYPAVDSTRTRPSHAHFAEGFFLTRDAIAWFTANYRNGSPSADVRLSPLVASDLSRLSPALVVTAAFDPLRDEGEAYAAALRDAGGTAILRRFDGLIHGFINLVGVSPSSRDATIEIAGSLRTLFALGQGGRSS